MAASRNYITQPRLSKCALTPRPPKHWHLGNLCVGSTIILPLFQHSLQDSVGSQRAPGHSGPGQGKPGDEGCFSLLLFYSFGTKAFNSKVEWMYAHTLSLGIV